MQSEAEHVRLFEKHLACTESMQFHTDSVTLLGFPCSTSTSSCVPLSLFPVPGQMYQICSQLAWIQPFWFVNPQKQLQKSKLHSSVFQHAATSHEKFMSTASKDRCSPFTLAAYVSVIALFCWINAYHQSPAQISIMKDLTVITIANVWQNHVFTFCELNSWKGITCLISKEPQGNWSADRFLKANLQVNEVLGKKITLLRSRRQSIAEIADFVNIWYAFSISWSASHRITLTWACKLKTYICEVRAKLYNNTWGITIYISYTQTKTHTRVL